MVLDYTALFTGAQTEGMAALVAVAPLAVTVMGMLLALRIAKRLFGEIAGTGDGGGEMSDDQFQASAWATWEEWDAAGGNDSSDDFQHETGLKLNGAGEWYEVLD